MRKIRRFSPSKFKNIKLISFVAAFAVVGGIIALIVSHAAPALVIDTTVPVPQNVKAFPDDQNIIVTWDDTRPAGVVGYYVQYRKKGATTWEGTKQTIFATTQLQPLQNGQEYEITVQSARGTYLSTDKGDLVQHDAHSPMYWARADGHVSNVATTSGTPSSARVDKAKQQMTGFFDDFNEPANPMDETKWNQSAFCKYYDRAGAFINNQFHAHNSINCEFGAQVARPRATFDTTTGLNGGAISEANPAQVQFDMDASTDGRSKWYLDFVPLTSRTEQYPTDLNGHHAPDDSVDHSEAGNMLRLDLSGGGNVGFTYWDKARNFRSLWSYEPPSVCSNWGRDWGDSIRFQAANGCPTSTKTLGQSPLAEQNSVMSHSAQNVRRHWVIQFTPTKAKIFIDGAQVGQASLPSDWVNEKKYTLQNTMFSYNTGKEFQPSIENPNEDLFMGRHGVIPFFHFYHWDNFGFTGPAPTTVTHNYIEGGPDGNTPQYMTNSPVMGTVNRTTNIKIPDPIGSPTGDVGQLYFAYRSREDCGCLWSPGEYLTFNGKRYDIPDPETVGPNMPDYSAGFGISALTMRFKIPKADIKTGDNIIVYNGQGSTLTNVHLELAYPKGSAPSYTQPVDIYKQAFSNIVEPKLTNCDSYIYVEQDLGLPYPDGRSNLAPGPCVLLNTIPNHAGHTNTTPSDSVPPTVSLTAPANNSTLTGSSMTVSANASDNVGVSSVSFLVGGVVVATDSSAPYSANVDFTSFAAGTYTVTASAKDTSNLSSSTTAISVIKPAGSDTTKPVVTGFTPPNGTSVAANATTLKLTVNATDNVGITRVEFILDNALIAVKATPETGSTYSYTFNPASLQAGQHVWRNDIYDAAGNKTVSADWFFSTTTPTVSPDPNPTPNPNPLPQPNPTPGKVGDINGDGKVNIQDLVTLINNYSKTVPANTGGDLNGDGKVGIADLSMLLNNWGK